MAIRFGRLKINRLWGLVAIALALGLLATWLATTYLRNREQDIQTQLREKAKGGPTVKVIVATSNLPRGATVQEGTVAGRDIEADMVYADTLTLNDFNTIKGRPLLRPVLRGRPLMRQDVIDDSPQKFSQALTNGMRAITVDIDELNSIAQMLKPGDFVDLNLITSDPSAPGGGQQVFPFLQHVKVIATGQRGTTTAQVSGLSEVERQALERYANATVEVTPQEAATIALAQNTGRIRITLRSPEDKAITDNPPVTTAQLVGGKAALAGPGGSAPKPVQVEYIVGGGGAGAAPPININVPNMPAAAGGARPAPGAPSAININGLPPEAAAILGQAVPQLAPTARR